MYNRDMMGNKKESSWLKSLAGFMTAFAVLLLFCAFSILSYSESGYTVTRYPGEPFTEFTVCMEGEANPTEQYFSLNDTQDNNPTVNPFVVINNNRYAYNISLKDTGMREAIRDLKLGCNKVKFGSASDTEFTLTLEYKQHWRPLVKSLQVRGLRAGEDSAFFVDVEDVDSYGSGLKTNLKVIDVTSRHSQRVVFNETFEGLKRDVDLGMGNYVAEVRVFDGYVWSDTYQTSFTVTVVRTDEHLYLKTVAFEQDDVVGEWDGWIPLPIRDSDKKEVRKVKRAYNGMYVVVWRTSNFVRGFFYKLKRDYFS
jgi:hypothetical protein